MANPTVVNERTTHYLTVTPKDKAGNAAIPATMSYRVDCVTTGTAVRALTSITPGAPVEITLTPDDLAIQNAANATETRRVTVNCGYGASDEVHDEYVLLVKNLEKVS